MTTDIDRLAAQLIQFIETGTPPAGLFAPDVFVDFTLPRWRMQAKGIADAVALRTSGHPGASHVIRSRCDVTSTGFVLELEERWTERGEDWYAREMFRADVTAGTIVNLCVYCTGDWDRARVAEHAREVRLFRP